MEGKLNAGDAKCPFFCAHTMRTVICEGLIPDSRDSLIFAGREGKRQSGTPCPDIIRTEHLPSVPDRRGGSDRSPCSYRTR